MTLETLLASGFLMGLAGSLHCAGLCGGIASSLLLATHGGEMCAIARVRTVSSLQLGRVLVYVLAGASVGTLGGALDFMLQLSQAQPVLRLLAAFTVVCSGLSIAGVLPAMGTFDGRIRRSSAALTDRILPGGRWASPLLAGIGWGFAPCAMVYNALLTGMLAGSPQGGAMFMAGFGVATVPAVGSVALGVSFLKSRGAHHRRKSTMRKGLGLGLTALGLLSLVEPAMSLSALCLGM
ncbi:sulfite exporter TauE/SafE family protein [Agrobacterium tumefaciens]|uniref:sulfite exporter TauE/SafE family protein n=1 Tax=Agrobacterium fabrum TaxID=1176649 RepID=UPI0015722314|nr:sulfite exporter TauE/SafE family protein [Agrobacterium fabrum]NTE84552.1 sulfite exporter TauE/SafE family protein [Agrobacterium tumefaciens]